MSDVLESVIISEHPSVESIECPLGVNNLKSDNTYGYSYYLAKHQLNEHGALRNDLSFEELALPSSKIIAHSGVSILKSGGMSQLLKMRGVLGWAEARIIPHLHQSQYFYTINNQGIRCLICGIKAGKLPAAVLERHPIDNHPISAYFV